MKTYKLKDIISQGTKDLFYIWWQELKAVVKDQGCLLYTSDAADDASSV